MNVPYFLFFLSLYFYSTHQTLSLFFPISLHHPQTISMLSSHLMSPIFRYDLLWLTQWVTPIFRLWLLWAYDSVVAIIRHRTLVYKRLLSSDANVQFWTVVQTWTCLNQTQVWAKVQRNHWTEPKVQFKVQRMVDGTEPHQTWFKPKFFGQPRWAATGSHWVLTSPKMIRYQFSTIKNGTVSIMSRPLWAHSRIALVLYLLLPSWVWK